MTEQLVTVTHFVIIQRLPALLTIDNCKSCFSYERTRKCVHGTRTNQNKQRRKEENTRNGAMGACHATSLSCISLTVQRKKSSQSRTAGTTGVECIVTVLLNCCMYQLITSVQCVTV